MVRLIEQEGPIAYTDDHPEPVVRGGREPVLLLATDEHGIRPASCWHSRRPPRVRFPPDQTHRRAVHFAIQPPIPVWMFESHLHADRGAVPGGQDRGPGALRHLLGLTKAASAFTSANDDRVARYRFHRRLRSCRATGRRSIGNGRAGCRPAAGVPVRPQEGIRRGRVHHADAEGR